MRILTFFSLIFYSSMLIAQNDVWLRASTSFGEGNFQKAYRTYKEAASYYLDQKEFEPYTDARLQMAECLLQEGDVLAAREEAKRLQQFLHSQSAKNNIQLAQTYTKIGVCELNLGNVKNAIEQLKISESYFENNASEEKAACLDGLGLAYTTNQNKTLATQYLEMSLDIRQELFGRQSVKVANSYNNLGRAYLNDEPLQALIYFNKARLIYEKKLGETNTRTLRTIINIAFANINQGDYEKAVDQLTKVRVAYSTTYPADHPNKAYILTLIGKAQLDSKSYDQALTSQKKALNMYIGLFGEKHPEVANSYFLIGEVLRAKNEYKEAVNFYQRSIYANIPELSFTSMYELPTFSNHFNQDILLSSVYGKAVALADLHFEKSLNLKDLLGAIDTYEACGELISLIRRGRVNEQDKIRLGELAKDVYENGLQLSLILSEQSFKKKKYEELAFDFCERSKSAVLLEAIRESNAKNFAGIPASQLAIEDSLKSQISTLEQQLSLPENIADQSLKASLLHFQKAYEQFIQNLETAYPKYYQLKYDNSSASLASVQQKLDNRTAVLSYFIGKQQLYLFTVTQKKLYVEAKEIGDDFHKKISGLRNSIQYDSKKTFHSLSRSLHQLLIPEIPTEINKLVVIPDGALGTLPFAALVDPSSDATDYAHMRYLIQDYQISYDYSATLFSERESSSQANSDRHILLVAPVHFQDQSIPMRDLPGSGKEIDQIKYTFIGNSHQATVRKEHEASEAQLKKENLNNYQYIHLATHGVVDADEPALSRIFLTPNDAEDGSLYTGEIYNLKINADLVTLSACETGLGKLARGEGIVGLSRALQYAGTRNLMVSLWQVADASTASLMIQFYETHLLDKQKPMGSALRTAQQSLIGSESYARPYFWASFILIGR